MEGRILTCVYCGKEYPQGTPASGDQVLTDHIKICEKHPMRVAEKKICKLRSALVGLIGSGEKAELDAMAAHTRTVMAMGYVPQKDGVAMINAIDILIETISE